MDRAVGPERMKVLCSQFSVWERCGGESGIEEWRQRMLGRMFRSLNLGRPSSSGSASGITAARGGPACSGRGATRVSSWSTKPRPCARWRPALTSIPCAPGSRKTRRDYYRWSGYAEAMAGKSEALEGSTLGTGATAELVLGRGLGEAAPVETPGQRTRRHLKALVHYRQLLGIAGRPPVKDDASN